MGGAVAHDAVVVITMGTLTRIAMRGENRLTGSLSWYNEVQVFHSSPQ